MPFEGVTFKKRRPLKQDKRNRARRRRYRPTGNPEGRPRKYLHGRYTKGHHLKLLNTDLGQFGKRKSRWVY